MNALLLLVPRWKWSLPSQRLESHASLNKLKVRMLDLQAQSKSPLAVSLMAGLLYSKEGEAVCTVLLSHCAD